MSSRAVSKEELRLDVEAYYQASGNKSEAARLRSLKRKTYSDRLTLATRELGIVLGKVADGNIAPLEAKQRGLPRKGRVRRYILTSLQNNTHLHPGFESLLTYNKFLDDLEHGSCELLIGTFSYQKAAYGHKSVKRGSMVGDEFDAEWYAPGAKEYIADDMIELAPGLVWCGHMNIIPTAKHPLTALDDYNGRKSNVVPHAQIAMESVASMADEATKFNYTTGTIGQRNYIQKRAGQLAEQRHNYGAVIVEVDHVGNWWVRQLHIDPDNTIYDLAPSPETGSLRIQGNSIEFDQLEERGFIEAINWGDTHASELELWVRELAWGAGGMLDQLRCQYQFMNDVFSMRSRGHHEMKDFHRMYAKHVDGEETVEEEVQLTADLLQEAKRDYCETVVVPSNHDKHLTRWLNEADFRQDPHNAKFFCMLQYHLLDAMDRGDEDFNVLEFALNNCGDLEDIRFLANDESFVICKDTVSGGVECGLHGDQGPNGSRGSTQSLTKLGRAVNKGHDHTAAIRLNVYSAGACSLQFPYMSGPGSHSISHIGTFKNGTRQIWTMWNNQFRA